MVCPDDPDPVEFRPLPLISIPTSVVLPPCVESDGVLPAAVPVLPTLPLVLVEVPKPLGVVDTGAAAGERCKSQNQSIPKSSRKSSAPMIINSIFLVMDKTRRL
jgi:hypothetical protein